MNKKAPSSGAQWFGQAHKKGATGNSLKGFLTLPKPSLMEWLRPATLGLTILLCALFAWWITQPGALARILHGL